MGLVVRVIGVFLFGLGTVAGAQGPGRGAAEGWWVVHAIDTRGTEWHATLELGNGGVGGPGQMSGEFRWDTPGDPAGAFGRELVDGYFESSTNELRLEGFELQDDEKVGTASYLARLDSVRRLLHAGRWDGPGIIPSDFWVGERAVLQAVSAFESGEGGWSGAARWDEGEGGLVVGDELLVAPDAFHGNWGWNGRVPSLLSFSVRWTGTAPATGGPVVTIAGGGEEARFRIADPDAFPTEVARTFLVPLRADLWEREEIAEWGRFLQAIDRLAIDPGEGGGEGEFFVDDVRLLRPQEGEASLVEWDFRNDTLRAATGSGRVAAWALDPVTGAGTDWPEALAFGNEEVGGTRRALVTLPESEHPQNPFLDVSPRLGLEGAGLVPNGGGRRMNRYTLLLDLKIVGETLTDEQGADLNALEPEDFAKSGGLLLFDSRGGAVVTVEFGRVRGRASWFEALDSVGPGERHLLRGQWHRVVLAVDASAGELAVAVDGERVLDQDDLLPELRPTLDGRFSLRPDSDAGLPGSAGLPPTLFGSESLFLGNEVSLAGLAIFSQPVPELQVAGLGGVAGEGLLAPVVDLQLAIEGRFLPQSMTLGFNVIGGFRYEVERSFDLCQWERWREVLAPRDGRHVEAVALDESREAFYRVRPVLD